MPPAQPAVDHMSASLASSLLSISCLSDHGLGAREFEPHPRPQMHPHQDTDLSDGIIRSSGNWLKEADFLRGNAIIYFFGF